MVFSRAQEEVISKDLYIYFYFIYIHLLMYFYFLLPSIMCYGKFDDFFHFFSNFPEFSL
jgi:hypothetical protein